MAGVGGGGEDDGQDELDEDKGELDPEGGAQGAVLAVFCTLSAAGKGLERARENALMPRRCDSQQVKTAESR